MKTELPWFFVVGAQKAGTTTLHNWLCKGGAVALPWSKETHFFRDAELFSKGAWWYLGQFRTRGQAQAIGEIDPEYMYFPECAERMKSFADAPKLIFVLRDPLSRAYSNYQMSRRRGYETLSFSDALCAEDWRIRSGGRFSQIHHGYMARGLYANQIERMLKVFPESKTMILLFEELFSSQESATRSLWQLCDFIGVSHETCSVEVSVRENQASEPRFASIRDFIYGKGKTKKLLGKFIPSREMKVRMVRLVDRVNVKPASNTDQQERQEKNQVPAFVYEAFITDLLALQRLGRVDVSGWIAEYERRLGK